MRSEALIEEPEDSRQAPSVPPVSQRRPKQSSRLVGLDAARVLATFGIVWVHVSEIQGVAAEWTTLGRFGTSFYIIGAVFFSVRTRLRNPDASLLDQVRRRARRLLLPYLIWCALYAAFYLTTMLPQGYTWAQITRHWGPLFGTAPHLWFLPFAFVAGVLASVSVKALDKLPSSVLLSFGLSLTALAYLAAYGWALPRLHQGELAQLHLLRVGRWVEELPLALGAIFGVTAYVRFQAALGRLGKRRRLRLAAIAAASFCVVQGVYVAWLDELTPLFWTDLHFFANAAGACWLVAFLAARDTRLLRRLAPLGQATYFAFLAHQLVIDLTKRTLSVVPGHGTVPFALASSALVFAFSVWVGLKLRHSPKFRLLIP